MASGRDIQAGRAFVELYIKDKLSGGLAAAGKKLKTFGHTLIGIGKTMSMIRNVSLIPAAFAVKLAADNETVATSFRTLVGDTEKASKALAELKQFAARTPFEFPELADASKSLIAFGVATEDLLPTLHRIGDLSAGLNIPVGELAEIYGKAKVQGRLFMEDINQLTGRGIPVIQEFAKQFGVAESEVRKLVEQGQIGFPNLERAFADMTGAGGKFSGMMSQLSGTFSGLWSSMMDAVKETASSFGKLLIEGFGLKEILGQITEAMERLNEWLSKNRERALAFAGAVLKIGTAGSVLMGLGVVITSVGTALGAVATAAGALALPMGATALAATGAFALVASRSQELRDTLEQSFGEVLATAQRTGQGIADAFQAGDLQLAWDIGLKGLEVAFIDTLNAMLDSAAKFAEEFGEMIAESLNPKKIVKKAWEMSPARKVFEGVAEGVAGAISGKDVDIGGDGGGGMLAGVGAFLDNTEQKKDLERLLARARAAKDEAAVITLEGRLVEMEAAAPAPAGPAGVADQDWDAVRRNRAAKVKAPMVDDEESRHEERVRKAREKLAQIEEDRKQRVVDAAMGLPVESGPDGGPRGSFSAAAAMAMFGGEAGPAKTLKDILAEARKQREAAKRAERLLELMYKELGMRFT